MRQLGLHILVVLAVSALMGRLTPTQESNHQLRPRQDDTTLVRTYTTTDPWLHLPGLPPIKSGERIVLRKEIFEAMCNNGSIVQAQSIYPVNVIINTGNANSSATGSGYQDAGINFSY